jgi:hypothetical protein
VRPERFRWLLRLLPFDFRADYGREMEVGLPRAASRRARGRRAGALWRQAVADVARTAPREHLRSSAQDARYALRAMAKHRAFTGRRC